MSEADDDVGIVAGLLFSPHGRIARLSYLFGIVSSAVVLWIAGFMLVGIASSAMTLTGSPTDRMSVPMAFGLLAKGGVTLVGLYVSTVLDMKRLRDMGFRGRTSFAILALGLVAALLVLPPVAASSPLLATLSTTVLQPLSAVISVVLLLWPGVPAVPHGDGLVAPTGFEPANIHRERVAS